MLNKVAFLCHPYHRGGVTRWMADAAAYASKNGAEVYFITVDPVVPFFSGKGREKMITLLEEYKSIKIISKPVNYTFEFGTPEFRSSVFIELIKTHLPAGIPIILSDDNAVWSAAAAVADHYPMIGVMHGNDDHYFLNAQKYARQLSLCVCVSNRVKKNVITRCPAVQESKISVIPCGILLPVFAPTTNLTGILNMAFIGRMEDKVKRATDLVKISASLQQQQIPFHLHIIGNNKSSEETFGQSFTEAGIANVVTFHGWLAKPEIQQFLNASDILLLTSNSEGMPLVMMEALASGCGFTGTRVSGIEDYENDPYATNCFSVYTAGDIDDATTKIKKVAAIPALVRQKEARKLAESEFSIPVCLQRYTSAVEALPDTAIAPATLKFSTLDAVYSKMIALSRQLKMTFSGKK